MPLTLEYRRRVNDKVWGGTDFVPPASYYFGLSTTTIAADGTNVTEPVGNGYARVAIANIPANFPSGAAKSIAVAITFPAPTGGGWIGIRDWVVFDAASGGTVVAFGTFATSPFNLVAGAAPFWPAGTFTFEQAS